MGFGWVQIIGICGLFETVAWPASDYSCSYGWQVIDDAGDGDKLTKEIQNGRAAMIGIAGIWRPRPSTLTASGRTPAPASSKRAKRVASARHARQLRNPTEGGATIGSAGGGPN